MNQQVGVVEHQRSQHSINLRRGSSGLGEASDARYERFSWMTHELADKIIANFDQFIKFSLDLSVFLSQSSD